MPTKRKPKRKQAKSRTSRPVAIDPEKYPIVAPPAQGISAPYAYGPTYEELPYAPRAVDRLGGTDSATTETASGTKTTNIGTVADQGILMNYSVAGALLSGSITAPVRFRLDIVRAGSTIFSVNAIVAGIPGQDSVASQAEIMMLPGDVVNLVTVRGNMTSVTWSAAAQIVIQRIR